MAARRQGSRPPVASERRRRERPRAASERRRRERHFARRRRDLLEDAGIAAFLAIVLIASTAGLGVVALIMLVVGAALAASVLVPRVRARRRARAARRVAPVRAGSNRERRRAA